MEAVGDNKTPYGYLVKTIAFGLTLGVLVAAIILAMELMWQAFAGAADWTFYAFAAQSVLIFLVVAMVSGALYAISMRNKADLKQLLIGDLVAGAVMGAAVYVIILASAMEYSGTMINPGFNNAHETGLAYDITTFLGPFLFLAVIGAIATSMGAVTCRSVIIRRKPTGYHMKNAALGTIGLIALIVVAPPLAALVLSMI